MMIGTADEVAAQGIKIARSTKTGTRSRRPRLRRAVDAVRVLISDMNPAFYPVAAAVLTLLIAATILLRFNYQHPRMSWVDALYFTAESMTTTGYGDFSFVHQPTWLRLFAAALMFGGVTTTALLVAFIADVLLSRRFVMAAVRPRARHLRNHIVVVGLSALGMRVVSDLVTAGYDVAVIEIDEENRYLPVVRELDVPVIFGDATLVPDPGIRAGGSGPRGGGADPRRHDQHRNRHGAGRNAWSPGSAPCIVGPKFRWYCGYLIARWVSRWRSDSDSSTLVPLSSWPRRGSSAPRRACRCWARSRWGRTPLWSAGCGWRPAVNSTVCACPNYPPKPGSSRSLSKTNRSSSTRDTMHVFAPVTPSTSSGLTANFCKPCARDVFRPSRMRRGEGPRADQAVDARSGAHTG